MLSQQHSEVGPVLIPFYRQGNRFREFKLPVQVHANSNLGLSDSDPRMFLTSVLCQTPICQIRSILKRAELFWTCVHLFHFLTFEELFASLSEGPFIQNGARATTDHHHLWPESPVLG